MKAIRPQYAFFGHHKGATDWMNSILAQVCNELKLRFSVVHYPEMFNGDLKNFVQENKIDFLSYDNADYEYVKQLAGFRAFHIIRDPRDIAISAYYSHLYSHGLKGQITAEQRKTLQDLTKSDGLLYELQCREKQFKEMHNWNYSQPNVLELRMEELTQNPYKNLVKIFDFLGLVDDTIFTVKKRFSYCLYLGLRRVEARSKREINLFNAPGRLPVERLLGIIWENDFSKKTGGREPGQENIKSHYRKGTPGDWKNHFENVHYDYFYKNYNHVLLKLGYERDSNWIAQYIEPINSEERSPLEKIRVSSADAN
jgi:hypothetical protein